MPREAPLSWRAARSITTLQAELNAAYPNRTRPDWLIGDAAHAGSASDHNPNSAGVVCAVDVRGTDMGQILWDHIRTQRPAPVKYMIFRGRIMSATTSPWVSRVYNGSNPHNDHIHISVGRGPDGRSTRPDLYDSTAPWGISSGGTAAGGDDEMLGLRRGDSGQAVRSLQVYLRDCGHPPANSLVNGEWDGKYGPATAAAVLAVRRANGSDATSGDHVSYWARNQLRRGWLAHQLKGA